MTRNRTNILAADGLLLAPAQQRLEGDKVEPQDLLTAPLGALVPLEALDRQRRWEAEGVNRAIRRFREIEADRTTDQRVAGRSVLRDVVPRLIVRIKEAQAEALALLTSSATGTRPVWCWYVNLLPADQLAVLTVVETLSMQGPPRPSSPTALPSLLNVAMRLAKAVRLQAEFGQWVSVERSREEEAKLRGGVYLNLYELLRRNAKKIDHRSVKMWWRRTHKMRDEPWPKPDTIQFGSALVTWMVEVGGGWFEAVLIPQMGGKSGRVIRLTAAAREAMTDLTTRAESAQAWNMPMLCPPNPWKWNEDT